LKSGKTLAALSLIVALSIPAGLRAETQQTNTKPAASIEQTLDPRQDDEITSSGQTGPQASVEAPSPEDIAPYDIIKKFDTAEANVALPESKTPVAEDLLKMSLGGAGQDSLKPLDLFNTELSSSVNQNVRMFSSTLKGHFSQWLSRSGKYTDVMKGILREKGLPEDLVFLALIESGFNPMAYSWAQASGPWQFIRGTAKRYGLSVDSWVDERRDPIKSTKAAAEYLKDLYNLFGTWSLAMASYNAGEGNVAKAVMRNGSMDFWELRKSGSLANETKEYVPKFIAAKMIAQNPTAYGFDNLEYETPFQFDEVVVDKAISLEVAAKYCGVSARDIKELNPELKRWCTPPNRPGYTLRVPLGTRDAFLENYRTRPENQSAGWTEHTVRRGESMKGIARKYGVSVAAIAKANGVTSARRGQSLIIPIEGVSSSSIAGDDEGAPRKSTPHKAKRSTYKVRRGDTLSGISDRFGVSPKSLIKANSLQGSKVRPGQKLVIPKEDAA